MGRTEEEKRIARNLASRKSRKKRLANDPGYRDKLNEMHRKCRQKQKAENPELYALKQKEAHAKFLENESQEHRRDRLDKRNERKKERKLDPVLHEKDKTTNNTYTEKYRKQGKRFGCKNYVEIENYDKGVVDGFDKDKWECHHKRENYYRSDTLKKRGEYYGIPADQLIWLPRKKHNSDQGVSISNPLGSKWHKSLFDVMQQVFDFLDRSKLPKEFDELLNEVEEHYENFIDSQKPEYIGYEEYSKYSDIVQKSYEFAMRFPKYWLAMILVETGKKKIW